MKNNPKTAKITVKKITPKMTASAKTFRLTKKCKYTAVVRFTGNSCHNTKTVKTRITVR